MRLLGIWLLPIVAAFFGTASSHPIQTDDRAAILASITHMEKAWNRGDFRGYMAGFKNPDVVFVSGGRIQDGWQGTLDHYVRDYGGSAATRGKLHFYDMQVELLAPDAAMLTGHYHLERPGNTAEGVNTRLFRKIDGRWLITLNHVSAYTVPDRPSTAGLPPDDEAAGKEPR